jgi:F-type H+-transporting ATPase subunit delta
MHAGGLTERYVKALSGMDLPRGLTLSTLHEEIGAFAQVYEQGDVLREVFVNPFFSATERQRVIDELAKRFKVSPITRNLVSLLVDKQRAPLLPEIARELGRLLDARSGVQRALVTSAAPLKKAQLDELGRVLQQLRGSPVRLEHEVDSTLLGGVVIEMEGTVYDGSVKKRLQSIRSLILKEAR